MKVTQNAGGASAGALDDGGVSAGARADRDASADARNAGNASAGARADADMTYAATAHSTGSKLEGAFDADDAKRSVDGRGIAADVALAATVATAVTMAILLFLWFRCGRRQRE